MGTSGNRKGYKIFSISTTIRNPIRNTEFLKVFKKYDNCILTSELKDEIYTELVKQGIYQLTNVSNEIKNKYENGEDLTEDEIKKAIIDNPQKTRNAGRLMTQIRAIKDVGFLTLTGSEKKPLMNITPLGNKIIEGYSSEDIYTKAMIGLHANNPQRVAIYNKSRPFLNTLFVIEELNKYYNNNKGIMWHEFATFVLSMKDCNYKDIANKIIEYRKENQNKINRVFIENYLYNDLKLVKIDFKKSLLKDYPDDVYRKFAMTGLIDRCGFGKNLYIRFNEFNIEKVKSIIKKYEGYSFQSFLSTEDYVKYLENIVLPWEKSDVIKEEIIKNKEDKLGIKLDDNLSLDNKIEKLDEINNKQIFDMTVNRMDLNSIIAELVNLSRSKKSSLDTIPPSIRLEWLVSLLMAKMYGSKYVKPNLHLDNNGFPRSCASGGKADIEFVTEKYYFLLEVTMIRDYKQQLNSETTSISDHLNHLSTDLKKASILIAPYIHKRVVSFFEFIISTDNANILATTIERYLDITTKNPNIESYYEQVLKEIEYMYSNDAENYCDKINGFKLY